MPRSLAFCQWEIAHNLASLCRAYGTSPKSYDVAADILVGLQNHTIDSIMNNGLHEFITDYVESNQMLADQIETDYRFYAWYDFRYYE